MRILTFVAALLAAAPAFAQSVPNGNTALSQAQIWSPAQWTLAWQSKADANGGILTNPTLINPTFTNILINGGTLTGTLAGSGSINITGTETAASFSASPPSSASALYNQSGIHLYNSSGGLIAGIGANATSTANLQQVLVTDTGLLIGGTTATPPLLVPVPASTAVNGLEADAAVTGSAPSLGVQGTDTNISLKLAPKGSGSVVVTAPVSATGGGTFGGTWAGSPALVLSNTASAASNMPSLLVDTSAAIGMQFFPSATAALLNPLVSASDQAIINGAAASGTNAMTIAPWSATRSGIRMVGDGEVYTANNTLDNGGGGISISGHIASTGTIPTLSACGTSPTISTNSTDTKGAITEGTTSTGCTVTFATAYTSAPMCVVSSPNGILPTSYSASTTALTIVNASATGDQFNYSCVQ